MMQVHRSDLLNIECTSASKPSLLSSFWSINVQMPQNERLDIDTRACSQYSLPEASSEAANFVRKPTRSLSVTDINTQFGTDNPSAPPQPKLQLPPQSKESCNLVSDWLTNLDLKK